LLDIVEDDLSGEEIRALLALHLADMHATTPTRYAFALDLTGLQQPGITVWSAWRDGRIAGVGALKDHGDRTGELKSMRTHPDHLRRGVGAALLEHIIAEGCRLGMRRLSLETGVGPAFDAALSLYRKRGFVDGLPFANYLPSDFNQFLHLDLPAPRPSPGRPA
jgi:putative acetyltransferase